MKDLILEEIGLGYSRLADGMVRFLYIDAVASLYAYQQHLKEGLPYIAQAGERSIYRDSLRVIASRDAAYSVMFMHSHVR